MLAQHIQLQSGGIRDALRVQTRGVHEQLHHHSHFVALFDQTISLPQYIALLQRFHDFYAPLERVIDKTMSLPSADHGGYLYAPRAAFLSQDLFDLDAHRDTLPLCPDIEAVVTPASLAGVLYVIEGSTLGAAQIDRAAQKLFSKNNDHGRKFWAWCRAHNTQRWAMMNTYLDHLDTQGARHSDIVDGANGTFQALADWLAPLHQPALETVQP